MTAQPKYRAIEAALRARIAAGEFGPGDAIPHEAQLAEAYGATRPTVARAMAALVEDGLIERRRRAGSRVAAGGRVGARVSIPLAREEIAAAGAAYGYRLLDRRMTPPPAAVAAALDLPPGAAALWTRALHLADGAPWQLEERWISLTAAPGAATVDFAAVSPNEWLVAEIPLTRTEHVLSAAAADPAQAAALALTPGAPVFVVERATWRGAEPVTRVAMLHPGATFRLRLTAGG